MDDNDKIYLEERASLNLSKNQSEEQLDKAILTLSGGAFGISMVFLKDLVSPHEASSINMLVTAWAFLISSMLATLFSILFSQFAYGRAIQILEDDYLSKDSEKVNCSNGWSTITLLLNIGSIISFTAGLMFLIIFSIKNL